MIPHSFSSTVWSALAVGGVFLAGLVVGERWAAGPRPPVAQAMSSLADQTFAVCTAPIDAATEGLFILDFETGDLTGGVLAQTGKFAASYRHNVLADLGIEVGAVKNQRFMIVPGMVKMGATARMALSVLYVTDAATGVTVAYGIPTGGKPGATATTAALVPLDIARPRSGGPAP
jgi:hypothetical protein